MNNKKEIPEWVKGCVIWLIVILAIEGIAFLVAQNKPSTSNNSTTTTSTPSSNTSNDDLFTLEDAQKFVGKSIWSLCPSYGNHNIHVLWIDEDGDSAGGDMCRDLYLPAGDYEIFRVFYDEDDGYYDTPEEYRPRERRVQVWVRER
jgi:hypothetical protein